tara:strand:+ start:116 stop:1855 length:1740 start_codon:yes stop_codon:yes gene_type:complete
MANEIRLKRGSGSDPGASDLVLGEPAVRTDTGEIFLKKDDGSIAKVAGGIDDGDKGDITVSNSGGTFTIDSGVITNAKVSGSAAIAGSKISPDFGSQAIATTSSLSCFAANITGDNQDSLNFTGSSTNANRGIAFNSKTALSHSNDTVLRINNNSEFNTVSITGAITATGDLTITSTVPRIFLTDSNNDSDFAIANSNGVFKINDETNSLNRLSIASDGTTTIAQNLDVGAGIDVTGVITATSHIELVDNSELRLGNNDDLKIFHSGTVSFIDSPAHELRIRGTYVALQPNGGGAQMALGTAGGSFALFHNGNQKLETSSAGIDVTGAITATSHIDLPDDAKVKLGTGDDFEIFHDGTDNIFQSSGLVNFIFKPKNTDIGLKILGDSGVEAYTDNTLRFKTTTGGVQILGTDAGGSEHRGRLYFKTEGGTVRALYDPLAQKFQHYDNTYATFGNDHDLQIFHNGSSSVIKNTHSSGALTIQNTASEINLYNVTDNEYLAQFIHGGATKLYHDGTRRLETTSYGSSTNGVHSIVNGILELKAAIATSHTLTTDYNAIAVDPTINNGVTVTVPSGAVWAIV